MLPSRTLRKIFLPGMMLAIAAITQAQTLAGAPLVHALQRGGYVIVMRHATSPPDAPTKEATNADNTKGERQLDETGRRAATAMGDALHKLKIPLGEVLSSPTYRALETVKYAKLGEAKTYRELGDGGKSMQGGTNTQARWLQNRVMRFPVGTNTIIVTHNPNLTAAFPALATGVADGEALVFGPDGRGGATLVARIKIGEWPSFQE